LKHKYNQNAVSEKFQRICQSVVETILTGEALSDYVLILYN